MRRHRTVVAAALLPVIVLAACGNPQVFSDSEKLSAQHKRSEDVSVTYHYGDGALEPPANYRAYANSVTDFALRQLRVRAESAEGSFAYSPASAALQAALLANAASTDTRQEILQALGGGTLTLDDLNGCSSYFQSRMESVGSEQDEKNSVRFDGAVLIDENIDVKSSFLQANANFYGYDVFRYDYSGEYAAQKLADYLKPYTADSGVTLDGSLNMIAACAAGDRWLEASSEAAQGVFQGKNGAQMTEYFTSSAKLLRSKKASGVLKYTADKPLRLLVVVPDEGVALGEYLSDFDGDELNALLDSMDVTKNTAATLPAVSVTGGDRAEALSGTLAKSGLYSLFGDKAGFSALSYSESAALGELYELPVSCTIDRNGVNAAQPAATEKITASETFTVDRPFLFFLLDNETTIPVIAGLYQG